MTEALFQRLEFALGKPGDYFVTNSITLDAGAVRHRLVVRYLPMAATWTIDISTTTGMRILSGGWIRDRTDVLLGVTTPGRPLGGIMAYDPKGRGDPGPDAFYTEGVGLYYVPAGIIPEWFVKFETAVT